MDYNKIIILLVVIVVVILVVGVLFMMNPSKQESKIEVVTNGTVHTGSTFLVKLTDSNNNPIVNQNLSIAIIDNKSNTVINKQITTNNHGEAVLEISDISAGDYRANITFNGDNDFKSSNCVHNLKIVDDAADVLSSDPATANVDEGAFYSGQAGRTVYTGEVQLAPDGHYWKHVGNNEWVRID